MEIVISDNLGAERSSIAMQRDIPTRRRETWDGVARAYATYTSPFRPVQEDITFCQSHVDEWRAANPSVRLRALMLGVTPDIVTMQWPRDTCVLGVDCSMPVIEALWPVNASSGRWPICGNWTALPCRPRAFDVIVGDGSLIAFRYPEPLSKVTALLRQIMNERAIAVIRCFTCKESQERPDEVIDDMCAKRIRNVNHFKFRLLLALQENAHTGVAVGDAYDYLFSRVSLSTLRAIPEWDAAAVEGFEIWRNAPSVYTFPSYQQLRRVLEQSFKVLATMIPTYELGSCCPSFVLAPKRW